MIKPLRVLIIEDSEDDALLVLRELRRGGYAPIESLRVDTADQMRQALKSRIWDLILSDYSMPQFNAPAALNILKESGLDVPFIIISGTVGEDTAVTSLLAGAHDFLVKGMLQRLIPAIEREVREAQERQRHREAEIELQRKTIFVRLMQEVAVAANEASTLVEAAQSTLDRFCDYTGWTIGHMAVPANDGTGGFVSSQLWHIGEGDFEAFVTATEKMRYNPDTSLVGRVGSSAQAAWIADLSAESARFTRRREAALCGLKSGFAFPILVGKEVAAVLEFFSSEPTEPDNTLLEVMSHVGTQLGRVAERERSSLTIRRYAEELELRVLERTAELERTKNRVEAILNNSSDAIVLTDFNGIIQQTNHAFSGLFEFTLEEVCGHPLTKLANPESAYALEESLRTVIHHGGQTRVEVSAQRVDGTSFAADIGIAAIPQEGGNLGVVICSIRDITERIKLEGDLRHALEKERELNALKTRFVSTVSHEFRTPLSTILSSTELLRNYSHRMDQDRIMEHFERISTSISHMTQQLDDVILISRGESGKLEFNPRPIDLERLCSRLIEDQQIAVEKTHRLQFTIEGQLEHVVADEILIRQIFTNLLSNAIKYSPAGGSIEVTLKRDEPYAIFQITDHGIGIPPKDRSRMFETFFRASNVGEISGSGLGMSIVKRALDLHSGTIDMQSEVGVGTTFTVRLPITPQDAD